MALNFLARIPVSLHLKGLCLVSTLSQNGLYFIHRPSSVYFSYHFSGRIHFRMDIEIEDVGNYRRGWATISQVVWKQWKRWPILFTAFAFVCLGNIGSTQENVLLTLILASKFAQFLTNRMTDAQSNLAHLGINSFQIIA